MPIAHVGGLDHVVILVRDLDSAAATWAALGFTVSPRGVHSADKGTGNHTIVLGHDYLELLGILRATESNATDREALDEFGEGLDRAAFRTDDAAGGLAALAALGIAGKGPSSFGRPVALPGGGTAEAAFRTFEWPPEEAPGGLRLFACEHLTPEAVWVPSLRHHANTATGIARLEILADDAEDEAGELARLTGGLGEAGPDGAWRVRSAPGRAEFVFLDPSLLAMRHPGLPVADCRGSGAAALVLTVADLAAAARAVPAAVATGPRSLALPPSAANGVLLVFEQA